MRIFIVGKPQIQDSSGSVKFLLFSTKRTRKDARKYIQKYLEKYVPADRKYTTRFKQWRRRWYISGLKILIEEI
jgi:hypothetical protein